MGRTLSPAAEEVEVGGASAFSAEAFYRERSARLKRLFDQETERWNRIANYRLFAFLAAAASLGWGIWQGLQLFWVAGITLLGIFVGLVVYHNIIGRQKRRHEELWRINVEAGHRVARRWDELPVRHGVRARPGDPYAGDLDIFGRASLFQLIETVSTHMGEATLSRWLREPTQPPEVRGRQEAVAELAPLADLRDELALRGRLMGEEKPDPQPFLIWAEGERWLAQRLWLVWWSWASVASVWALLLAQAFGLVGYPFWLIPAGANLLLNQTLGRRVHAILSQATSGEKGFRHYADLFELLSHARFDASALNAIQGRLITEGKTASDQMRRLHRLTSFLVPMSSQLYLPVQAVTLWDIHLLAAFERWQAHAGRHARDWLDALGEAEALAALAALAHDNPRWAYPDLDVRATALEARDLGHTLLPENVRVTNDVQVGPPGTFLLVTGSNMSGKSTLLRAIGVNIVLAQAGGPVCAAAMRLPPVALWTSMRIEDSLERGVSYFMAELQRLKQVVEAARRCNEVGERKLFYLLDEILQGTNTAERQIAVRRVLLHLIEQGAMGAISTHDLALAEIKELAAAARPVHFSETIHSGPEGPEMTFDYKLRPGVATSTNALRLMEIVGLALPDGRSGNGSDERILSDTANLSMSDA